MKHFFVFAILGVVGCKATILNKEEVLDGVLGTGPFEAIINDTIIGILKNITDPITIPTVAVDFAQLHSPLITGKFDLSKVSLSGIKSLVAPFIQLDIFSLGLNMSIEIPELVLKTDYSADVNLASLIPLYGNGLATVILEKLKLQIEGKAVLSPLSVHNVSVIFTMGEKSNFNFNGLLNNTEFSILVNQMLNDNIVPFIDDNKSLIGSLVSGIAEEVLNAILAGKKSTAEIYEDTLQALRNSEFGQNRFITV